MDNYKEKIPSKLKENLFNKAIENFKSNLVTEQKNQIDKWFKDVTKFEKLIERYISAERFISEILAMPFYKRLFIKRKAMKFIKDTLKKYDF